MRPYQYRCNDFSLVTPSFKQWIVNPLMRFVPWAIPANIITFASNGFVYVSLYLALNPEIFGKGNPLVISGGLFLYLVGDHLDGMQAKRTGTGSALGEFCDHYLDAFNNGVIMFIMITVFGISHKPVIAAVIIISYWAHMAVFYEQFKTGWLTFEPIGSLEGVLVSAMLIALSAVPTVNSMFSHILFEGYSFIEMLMILSSLGGLTTFIKTWKRTPDVRRGFWAFTFLLTIVGILALPFFTTHQLFVLLTLYASFYIGKVMHGHLIDGFERPTDFASPIALILLYIPGFAYADYLFAMLTAYLSVSICILIFKTISVLKMDWVWLNLRT